VPASKRSAWAGSDADQTRRRSDASDPAPYVTVVLFSINAAVRYRDTQQTFDQLLDLRWMMA